MNDSLYAVLLVDDEVGFLDVMGRRLRRRGIRATLAASGREALEVAGREHFDAVVTDLKMPGMDGLALMERLREAVPDLPVVLLTGHAGEAEAQEAVRRGAAEYLHKPCDFDMLLEALLRVVEEKHA